MCRQEFKNQISMAWNALGNAVHTSQEKQSGLLAVVWVLVGGFDFFLTQFNSKQNYFKVEIVALAASQKEWDLSAEQSCWNITCNGEKNQKNPLEFPLVFS